MENGRATKQFRRFDRPGSLFIIKHERDLVGILADRMYTKSY